jgi:hypothetical protein
MHSLSNLPAPCPARLGDIQLRRRCFAMSAPPLAVVRFSTSSNLVGRRAVSPRERGHARQQNV